MKFFCKAISATLILLIIALNTKATNDTLTIGQAFNWQVGDTFVYSSKYDYTTYDQYGYTTTTHSYGLKGFVVTARQDFSESILYTFHYSNDTTSRTLTIVETYNTVDTFDKLPPIDLHVGVCDFRPNLWSSTLYQFTDSSFNNLTTDSFNFHLSDETYITAFASKVGIKSNRYYYIFWGTHIADRYIVNCNINLVYYKTNSFTWIDSSYYFPTTINEPNSSMGFTLYPNPASTQLTITTETASAFDAYLYDVTGKCVRIVKSYTARCNSVNISDLPAGYYWLKLTGDNHLSSTKGFIISR